MGFRAYIAGAAQHAAAGSGVSAVGCMIRPREVDGVHAIAVGDPQRLPGAA
jgi:hypothetical protein